MDESLTSREFRAVDMNSSYYGVSTLQLMENAGRAVAEEVERRFDTGSRVAVVCGPGGNGGDGFVAARHLAPKYRVEVFLVGISENIRSDDARVNLKTVSLMYSSVRTTEMRDSAQIRQFDADVIIDALLGTGVRGELSSPFREAVAEINRSRGFKISVDVPTGVNSDSGEVVGEAVKANMTVTLHKSKIGFGKAKKYLGELVVRSIGVPP